MLRRLHTFDALSNENYRRLWLGQVGSAMGQWMDYTARGWLAYDMTHSPLHLGLVTASRGFPVLVLSLLAGILADKYSRRFQLVAACLADAFFSLILATLVLTGRIEIWHLYVTGFLAGSVQAFQHPARMTLINDIIGKGKLLNAMALNSAAFNLSRGIGPVLSGIIITYAGAAGSYYMEAFLCLWSAWLTLLIVVPADQQEALRQQAQRHTSIYSSAVETFKHVGANKLILTLLILGLAPMVLAMPFTSLFPLFAVDILKVGAAGQGLLLSSVGIGAFIGAIGVASMVGSPRGKTLLLSSGMFGIGLLFFSHSPWMWFSMAAAFIAGIANSSFNTQNQTIIQLLAPDSMRGRIVSLYLIDRGLTPMGTALAGVLANFLGGPNAVMVMGLCCIALTLGVAILVPRVAALGAEKATPLSA